jgi:ABC-type glycerol-3-phosphate transport system substrate-binding protein
LTRGNLYGVPWNMNSMLIFYAKERFDAAGLDYPTDDWTFDQFVELALALTGEEDGIQYYGYQTNLSYERLACWMRLNGDKEWDTEVEPTEARWDQEYIMEMINFQLNEVINTLKVSPTPAVMQGGANQLQSGNVAMKMEGPWFFPVMMGTDAQREGGTVFDVVQLPKGPNGGRAHMVFGHVLTMSNASQNKDAAWELLKFCGSEGGQKHVAAEGRQPVTPEFMRQFWVPAAQEQFGVENMEAFIGAFETGIVHLAGEVDDRYIYNEVLQAAFEAMVAGQTTAQEIIPQVNADIQAILDDYWSRQGA